MGARVYLQETSIRQSPRLDSCLVLKEIERFKPFTTFLFAHDPIYSFHSGIPVPPHLAMISLKRAKAQKIRPREPRTTRASFCPQESS
jgi:hypothetical protein